MDDDLLPLLDDDQADLAQAARVRPWKVLIVDDDPDVHDATVLALQGAPILNRPLTFLHAFSGAQALQILQAESGVAVVFLDVVMETADAGLAIIGVIREELGLRKLRIVLRTGQPGYAPDLDVITRYDINDYRVKSELTRSRLFTTLVAALRSYDQLSRLDASRAGLETIVRASAQLIAQDGLRSFSEGVITQISGLIGINPEGLVCCESRGHAQRDGDTQPFHIVAAAGRYRQFIDQRLTAIGDPRITHILTQCLQEQHNIVEDHCVALYFPVNNGNALAAFIDTDEPVCELDRHLLEVFCTNIGLCAANVNLVAELRARAFHDRLVGLPNRAALVVALDERLASPDKERFSLALIDIDAFAEANDMFGHQYGDKLLIAIGQRLCQALPGCIVARVAGDVFGLLGPKPLLEPNALHRLFGKPLLVGGTEHPVTVSIGTADLGDMVGSTASDGLKDAHIALKRAKSAGQGQAAHYSIDIANETRERARLLQDLRLALSTQKLYPVYQPQVDLNSGRVVGFEALVRWPSETGDFVAPDYFIPIAEQSGLVLALGESVLRAALSALKSVQNAGFPHLRMAINVSAVQLRHVEFIETVRNALHEMNIQPELVELEVTESASMLGMDVMVSRLHALRDLGVAIAIDDFGTGFSSLSYLDKLPADRVKIDRAFISTLDDKASGGRIAEMIVPLGHQMGMKVLAEGVESHSQANTLRAMGCDEAQGYVFARPMSLEDLLDWLKTQKT